MTRTEIARVGAALAAGRSSRGPSGSAAQRRILLRLGLLASAAGLGACIAWWWALAWAPATIALILAGLQLALGALDRSAHRGPPPGTGRSRSARARPERIAVIGAVLLITAMAAVAAVLAAWLLDAKTAAIGAYAAFLLMSLLGLPFWLSAIAEEFTAARAAQADRVSRD